MPPPPDFGINWSTGKDTLQVGVSGWSDTDVQGDPLKMLKSGHLQVVRGKEFAQTMKKTKVYIKVGYNLNIQTLRLSYQSYLLWHRRLRGAQLQAEMLQ